MEFRKIFYENANESTGVIETSDFGDMLVKLLQTQSIGSLRDSQNRDLRELHFSEFTETLMHTISHVLNVSLDFPGFLRVMRRVMDFASGSNEVKARSGSEEKAAR